MNDDPHSIQEIEWFASPLDLAKVSKALRDHDEKTVLGIMAIERINV